jgi:hypothetical protein
VNTLISSVRMKSGVTETPSEPIVGLSYELSVVSYQSRLLIPRSSLRRLRRPSRTAPAASYRPSKLRSPRALSGRSLVHRSRRDSREPQTGFGIGSGIQITWAHTSKMDATLATPMTTMKHPESIAPSVICVATLFGLPGHPATPFPQ